jgi:hypothetical protein
MAMQPLFPTLLDRFFTFIRPLAGSIPAGPRDALPMPSGRADAFADAGNGVVGNGTRNALNSPATDVWDTALIKDFPVTEKLTTEFRWEVFNVLNHPLFAAPSGDVSTGSLPFGWTSKRRLRSLESRRELEIPDVVPQGRLSVAQDDSPGFV